MARGFPSLSPYIYPVSILCLAYWGNFFCLSEGNCQYIKAIQREKKFLSVSLSFDVVDAIVYFLLL